MRKTTQSSLELLLPVLSDILTTIATVRDRSTLLKTIIAKLQPLFDFQDVGLFLVNEKENYHVDLAVDMPEINPLDSSMNHNIIPGKIAHQDSVVAWTIAQVEAAGQPVLFDFADLRQRFPDYPQWQGIPNGYRDCLTTTLKVQGEIIGMFCINALEKDKFATVDRILFQLVADQLAVALGNMLSHERLMEEKRFKETLLSISEAVASIQDRKHLFETIMANIKPVFPFDELGIFVNDDTGQYQRDLSIDNEFVVSAAFLHLTPKGWLPRHLSIDYFIEHGPTAMTLSELMRQFPDHPHYSMLQREGLKQIIAGPLVQGGKPVNLLCFWSRQEDFYSKAHLPMFRAISEQLSVAVANVLANEQVLLEKAKIERLYTVSEVMASIQHRHQLRAAFDRMRQVLPFNSAGLFVLTEDKQQHYELLDSSTLGGEVTQSRLEAQFGKYACYPHTPSPVEAMMQSEAVGLYSVADLLVRFPDYPQNPAVRAADLQQTIAAPLWQSEKIIGLLNFNSKQADQYSAADFPLVQAMAEQMSTVVSNILSNEREQEEKQFKETLLGISEAVASIQNRSQLLKVIFEKVQPVLSFDAPGLFTIDGEYHYEILDKEVTNDQHNEQVWQDVGVGPFANRGTIIQHIIDTQQAHITPIVAEMHPHGPAMLASGLKQVIYGPLKSRGKVIGMFCLNSQRADQYQEADLSLFQAIADQLAVAVANILSNEQLLAEKKKTEDLLAVTEAIANINSGPELIRAIFDKLQQVFPFDETGLFVIDWENQQERDLVIDYGYDTTVVSAALKEQGLYGWFPLQKLTRYLAEKGPMVIDADELLAKFSHPQLQYTEMPVFKQAIVGPLKKGDEIIGLLYFWSKADHAFDTSLPFFKSITDQLSVALSNILATEDIRQRERENALQVAVVNALHADTSWEEKLLGVAQQLQSFLPFDLFTVVLSEKQPDPLGYAFERIGHAEYRTLDTEAFLRLTKLSAERYRQLQHQHVYHEAFVANGRAFHELGERDTIKRTIAKVFKVESVLTVPLLLSQQSLSRPGLSRPGLSRPGLSRPGHFQFAFYRRSAEGYRPDQQALMQKIAPSLTLALEKLVAYDEISELNARLSQEKSYLEEEIRTHYNFGQLVGESSALQEVFTQINQVADTDSTVLLLGETGTGKELIARALHESSPRQKQSLIKINCAALPPQLIESELFGHEKGAFTGAAQRRIGKFELAHQSTIFLDEIGELPLELQSKLLRVLQEKEFERLGSNQVRRVDIRVVAATNRDLKEEVREGRFRQDLYYRLNVFPILLPPLRKRGKDIGLLAQFFLRKYSAKFKKRLASLNDAQLNKLQRYSWPGNVRELEHLIERAVIQASGRIATLNLPTTDSYPNRTTANLSEAISSEDFVPKPWKDTEVDMLMGTLRYCEGKVRGEGGAAQLLDLHPNTLESRMKKLGIKRQHVIN